MDDTSIYNTLYSPFYYSAYIYGQNITNYKIFTNTGWVMEFQETFSCRRDDIFECYFGTKICYDQSVNKLLIGPKQVFSQFAS